MVNFTALASNGSPFWKVTPWRSSNRQVVGVNAFQDVASPGA